jgi:hypothetical protein
MRPWGALSLFLLQLLTGAATAGLLDSPLAWTWSIFGGAVALLNFIAACTGTFKPRVYVAAAADNWEAAREAISELARRGYTITHDWTEGIANGRYNVSVQQSEADWRSMAGRDLEGAATADVLVLVCPAARGSHTELGVALGRGRPVVLVGWGRDFQDANGRDCVFYHHPLVACTVPSVRHRRVLVNAVQQAWMWGGV